MKMTKEKQQETINRLQIIFDSFLSKEYFATTNVYFEQLLGHLADKENVFVLEAPFARAWVDKCITLITEDFDNVHPKVIAFMFNFCSLMTLNEWILIEIRELRIVDRVIRLIERDRDKYTPSIKLGTIRLFAAVARYSLGLAYIRSCKAWHFLIDYCKKDHTLYVLREARELIYEILYKYSVKTHDEQSVMEMLNEIIIPINENVYEEQSESIHITVEDTELQHKLTPTLELLAYIFQKTLEAEEKTNIAHLYRLHHNMDITFWKLMEISQNSQFTEKILTTMSSYIFARLVDDKWTTGQIEPQHFNEFGIAFFNMTKFCLVHKLCENVLKLSELNHILWKRLGTRAPQEILIQNERVRFENQLILFHMMPMLLLVNAKDCPDEEIFDNYLVKLFEISSEHTLRICYAFRELLLTAADATDISAYCGDLAYKSIHSILSMENILSREQAVLVFQAMMHTLKQLIINSDTENSKSDHEATNCGSARIGGKRQKGSVLIFDMPHVLYAAVIGLQTLIKRFHITWKESIETICLVNFVTVLLDNSNLSPRLAVQALKLVQLAVEHFLSPNMALLVDNLNGSGLVCLGPIISKRFHDNAWEVRDSTLELVISMVQISRLKFPAFQQFLIEFKTCPVVFQMACNDCEPYVRASALRCIAEMVKITKIWESCVIKLDLLEHLFYALRNESEGIVRKEAANTLTTIYKYRNIAAKYKDALFSTFAYCVVEDLHWEVKVNALAFWELEVEKQFTNQGMIDGTFPTVTFSKENKKIVKLTEKEIRLRIVKIFDELSQRGCLGVILKCLKDDCDLEVLRTAVKMVQRLLEKLHKYDYESIVESMELASSTATNSNIIPTVTPPMAATITIAKTPLKPAKKIKSTDAETSTNPADADTVIESILSAQDINLLIASYETQMNIQAPERQISIDSNFYKEYTSVSAKDFITSIKRINLEQLLQNHEEWLQCAESFTSLLDDIMHAIQPTMATAAGDIDLEKLEEIVADCY